MCHNEQGGQATTKKYGEPWHRATREECGSSVTGILLQADGSSIGEMSLGYPHPQPERMAVELADRAAACVNACDGIQEPAALRTQRDQLLELARECARADSDCGHIIREQARRLVAIVAKAGGGA